MNPRNLSLLLGSLAVGAVGALTYRRVRPAFGAQATGERKKRIERSSQYQDGQFRNPMPTRMGPDRRDVPRIFQDFLTGKAERSPKGPLPHRTPDLPPLPPDATDVTWFGHSAVLLRTGGRTLLVDPMFGRRASPFVSVGSRRFDDLSPTDLDDLPPLDAVVLTHDHYDHLDHASILRLRDRADRFITTLGVGAHLEHWGVPAARITELDWWETVGFRGLTFTATPSRHFSGRGLTGRQQTLWGGFVIEANRPSGHAHKIYFGGDSGYGSHFREIGARLGPFDLALLECGQYSLHWPDIHMMPEETARAHRDVQGGVLLPLHWGAFNLSLHPWREPVERLLTAAEEFDITVATPVIGRTWRLGTPPPTTRWWRHLD